MDLAIAAENLEIGYPASPEPVVVSHIPSIRLKQGKLTCLLGANGIGKSTLLKTLTGNLNPLSGEITVAGIAIDQMTAREKAQRLAVVLTDKAHLGFTTVREMITLGRNPYTNWMNTLRSADSAAIDTALEAIGMTAEADRPLAELSDGNLQKVIIGRAIAQETAIIILDEPTIHLDISNKTMVVQLLRDLCEKHGKTILLSTHDLELARYYADELWLMAKNTLHQGLTEDIILQGLIEQHFENHSRLEAKELPNISISGNNELVELTRRALLKAGFEVADELAIKVDGAGKNASFTLDEHKFTRLAELLDYLLSVSRTR